MSCNIVVSLQGLIDASEDRFKKATHFGQGLITSSHFASEEVKEKVGVARWSHGPHPPTDSTIHVVAIRQLHGTLFVCLFTVGGSGGREE